MIKYKKKMGRDDRILSINLNCRGRSYYVIYHVQAAENFTNVRYLLWFLSFMFCNNIL